MTYDPRELGAKCDVCPLKGHAVVLPKPATGKLRLVIVGEGPGRKEESQGEPFVGASGALLNQVLDEVSVKREDCHITNAALCRGETDEDNVRAAACCLPRLSAELAALDATVPVALLGSGATTSVLGVNSILLARGFAWTARDLSDPIEDAEAALRRAVRGGKDTTKESARLETLRNRHRLAGRTCYPTVHPAFVLRSDVWRPIFARDMARAARNPAKLYDKLERANHWREFVVGSYLDTDDEAALERALGMLGRVVACDIETAGVTPVTAKILCVGVSDGLRTVVVGPWSHTRHAELLSRALRDRTVVFHNGYNFDHIALIRDGVRLSDAMVEDTLIAHHAFASHFPQRLDHVVSAFLDASPWKVKFGRRGAEEKGMLPEHMSPEMRHMYNAADARLTALAWNDMQGDLEPEQPVYEHDRSIAVMCRGMQVQGIHVDRGRKRILGLRLSLRAAGLKGQMRRMLGNPDFSPSKPRDVQKALFERLGAPVLHATPKGQASTAEATLEALKGTPTEAGRFADLLLKWRQVSKIKSTYVSAVSVHEDSRARYNWKSFGTVSGRLSCRLQSAPRWGKLPEQRVREMYAARPGCSLVYFDLSQAEARFAANLSGDANFIKTCERDVHVGNALVLFPEARDVLLSDPKGAGKPFRDIAKNAGFAVAYMAEAETVYTYLRSKGFPVRLADVVAMLDRLRGAYRDYYRYVDRNLDFARKNGYLRSALVGRFRWFGFFPAITEIANFPIQSGIADVMNTRLLELLDTLKVSGLQACLVAQIHDAAIFEVATPDVEKVKGAIAELWARPIVLPESIVCKAERSFVLPIDLKVGKRWSDFG